MRLKKKAKTLFLGLATILTCFCGIVFNAPLETKAMSGGTYKYLAIGNSITVHPMCSFWWGRWGMAATSADKDYVHLISSHIEKNVGNVSTSSIYYADWERASSGSDRSAMLYQLDELLTPDLDLVTIQLGENVSDTTYMQQDFQNLISYIWSKAPNTRIVMIGQFWQNSIIDNVKVAVANDYGIPYVNLSSIWGPEYRVGVGTSVWGADGLTHVIADEAVGQHPNDAAMAYIANSVNNCLSFSELYYDAQYGWCLLNNGKVDFSYTGMYYSPTYDWCYIRNGLVDWNYTGMACNEYGWWYYQNGKLDWNYTGMACNEYGWWYYRDGRLDWNYTGMACNEYGWWYYQNGQLDWGYTGMACNEYGWWYYQNGRLDWKYTGMACNEYGWWYYQNGRLDWEYTGMACNEYGWWYYQNGQLDWGYTGLGYNDYGAWLYNNGSIAWDYTGDWNGYTVENGHVL